VITESLCRRRGWNRPGPSEGGTTAFNCGRNGVESAKLAEASRRWLIFAAALGSELINDRRNCTVSGADGCMSDQEDLPAARYDESCWSDKSSGSDPPHEQARQAVLDGADYIGPDESS